MLSGGEKRGGDLEEAVEKEGGGKRNAEDYNKEHSQSHARSSIHQMRLKIA